MLVDYLVSYSVNYWLWTFSKVKQTLHRAPGGSGSQNLSTVGSRRWQGCQPYVPAAFTPQEVEASWNVMAHGQRPDFVFRRNGRVHLNRREGSRLSRRLAAEVCASAVVMLDTPCSEVVWRVLATHSIRQFPLHFPSRASPCAITFQLESNPGSHLC